MKGNFFLSFSLLAKKYQLEPPPKSNQNSHDIYTVPYLREDDWVKFSITHLKKWNEAYYYEETEVEDLCMLDQF